MRKQDVERKLGRKQEHVQKMCASMRNLACERREYRSLRTDEVAENK